MADAAAAALDAGAGEVHLHPKSTAGDDSLAAEDVARWLGAFRARCPGIPIGITTGEWAEPDPATRVAAIASWRTLPDMASVNWHEDGADEAAAALLSRGIRIEAGIWHTDGLESWLTSTQRSACHRVLIEVQPMAPEVVLPTARSLIDAVHAAEPRLPILLHGEEESAWPTLDLARELGLDTRIGFEDTLVTPEGAPAADNADLVHVAKLRLGV